MVEVLEFMVPLIFLLNENPFFLERFVNMVNYLTLGCMYTCNIPIYKIFMEDTILFLYQTFVLCYH